MQVQRSYVQLQNISSFRYYFTLQKYMILAFALLILLAVIALIVGLSVGLTKRPQ